MPRNVRSSGSYVEEDRGYETPCWIWQLSLTHNGYAQLSGLSGHVIFWTRKFGPVPEGKQLDHLCEVRACVNPDHLEPVAPAINVRRSSTAKLSQEQVDEIRSLVRSTTQSALAREFGVHPSQISRIVNYNRWKEVV